MSNSAKVYKKPMQFICYSIRQILEEGMEQQELADRIGLVIDAAHEDIERLKEAKEREKRRRADER